VTEQKPSEVAAKAAVWGLIEVEAKKHKDDARAWLHRRMGVDNAAVKAVANGETIGTASWVEGKQTLAVTDQSAFLNYVGTKHPTQLVTTVNPDFLDTLFRSLKVVGDTVIGQDGEPVPGVCVRVGASYVSVSKTKKARNTVDALLSSGRLQLGGLAEVTGGDPDHGGS
jgi:hypothetical protein